MNDDYSRYLDDARHRQTIEPAEATPPAPVPAEFVNWAYRLFLDREPESSSTVETMRTNLHSSAATRRLFMASEEFRVKNADAVRPAAPMLQDKLDVEVSLSDDDLTALLGHIKATWSALGETEPYWSVLSADAFRTSNIAANLDEFKASGGRELEALECMLRRSGIDLHSFSSAIEYGCGVGRFTRWLATRVDTLDAFDISSSHLGLANAYLHDSGVGNATLHLVSSIENVRSLPKADFVYSMIVLQHNPPPIMALILRGLLDALHPGGVAVIQMPTYRRGYSFSAAEYLAREAVAGEKHIEMHVLPQPDVFAIAADAGCVPVEVVEDDWAGPGYMSNTFVFRRR